MNQSFGRVLLRATREGIAGSLQRGQRTLSHGCIALLARQGVKPHVTPQQERAIDDDLLGLLLDGNGEFVRRGVLTALQEGLDALKCSDTADEIGEVDPPGTSEGASVGDRGPDHRRGR